MLAYTCKSLIKGKLIKCEAKVVNGVFHIEMDYFEVLFQYKFMFTY